MGFGTEKPRMTYVNIVGGKLAVKVPAGTEKSVSRKNKNGDEVHELIYPDLTAMLLNIECTKNDKLNAYEYRITLDDVGNTYVLSIPAESKYGDSFALRVLNLKKGEWYRFMPYDFEDATRKTHNGGAKRVTGINIFLNKEKVPYYFTKEDMKNHPPYVENMDEEDYKVYKIKLRKFYRSVIDEWTAQTDVKPATVPDNMIQESDLNTPSDGLPF